MKLERLACAVVVLCIAAPGAAFAQSCAAFEAQVRAAEERRDLDGLARHFEQATSGRSGCDSAYAFCLGRRISRAYVEEAYRRVDAGARPAAMATFLNAGLKFGKPWQLLNALGEATEANPDDKTRYDRSAAYYQGALTDIKEIEIGGGVCKDETELLPEAADALDIHRRASAASALAANFVAPPKLRDGSPGGNMTASLRGVVLKKRPVPITFEYNQEKFTPKGKDAADYLVTFLSDSRADSVHLTGHTDDVGSDAFNCQLSQRRLVAVQAYLKAGGFAGKIVIDARGEFEDAELDDPGRYTLEEKRALNRRVELRTADATGGRKCN